MYPGHVPAIALYFYDHCGCSPIICKARSRGSFPWKTIFISAGGNAHFGLPGGVFNPGTFCRLMAIAAFHSIHTVAILAPPRRHGMQMAVITLQRDISCRMTVHATGAHEHIIDIRKGRNRYNAIYFRSAVLRVTASLLFFLLKPLAINPIVVTMTNSTVVVLTDM
jgi:hypothetical protein